MFGSVVEVFRKWHEIVERIRDTNIFWRQWPYHILLYSSTWFNKAYMKDDPAIVMLFRAIHLSAFLWVCVFTHRITIEREIKIKIKKKYCLLNYFQKDRILNEFAFEKVNTVHTQHGKTSLACAHYKLCIYAFLFLLFTFAELLVVIFIYVYYCHNSVLSLCFFVRLIHSFLARMLMFHSQLLSKSRGVFLLFVI